MRDDRVPIPLPVEEVRESGLYFYEEAIEAYQPGERVQVAGHGPMLMLGSYSYLGLNGDPRISRAAREAIARYGTGTLGVRLLAGTLDLHKRLEVRIAAFKRTETAITFPSGFMANLSAITSLVGRNDVVFCDKLDHASIVDGCLLSQAEFVRFRHNDLAHLEQCLQRYPHPDRTRLVVVDGVYSMDGDIADLPGLSRLCREYDAWLMVDEAHSIGVLGETGHGIEEHYGLPDDAVDIKMGTLSKAIPSTGGYIATRRRLGEAIRWRGRGFIYSASASPAAVAAAIAALDVIEAEPERVERLHRNCDYFRTLLSQYGIPCSDTGSAIFPVVCGEDWLAYELAHYCHAHGVFVQAIPHPVVPKGTARLRACVNANHTESDLDYCAAVLRDGIECVRLFERQRAARSARVGDVPAAGPAAPGP